MPFPIGPRDAVPFDQLKRVLVVKLRHHGDVLLTSPVFSALKAHYPHLELDALVYAGTESMLSGLPAIAQIHTVRRRRGLPSTRAYVGAELDLMHRLRNRRYDLLVHLTESWRGLFLAHVLRPRYSVAYRFPNRAKFWKRGFTHLIPNAGPRRHTVEKHLDALRRLGLQPGVQERRLTLAIAPDTQQRVAEKLAVHGIAGTQDAYIHVHPTSRWLFKCWETTKFAQTINLLSERGFKVVLTAAPDEAETAFVADILAHVQYPIVNLAGQLNLKELAAVTARAKCFVGVDSVPMHIAAAVQTPVVVLFGPSGDTEWGPWKVVHKLITTDHSCRPCGFDGCGGGKLSECLSDIPVSRVFNAVLELVGE